MQLRQRQRQRRNNDSKPLNGQPSHIARHEHDEQESSVLSQKEETLQKHVSFDDDDDKVPGREFSPSSSFGSFSTIIGNLQQQEQRLDNNTNNDSSSTKSSNNSDDVDVGDEKEQTITAATKKSMHVAEYMSKREMTPFQERINALTVVPTFVFFIYYILSGSWLAQQFIEEIKNNGNNTHYYNNNNDFDFHAYCYSISWLPYFYAFPPLPVFAQPLGIVLHAPFSFIYHWHYAHRLSPVGKSHHWSRRMDQAMIHVVNASVAYASTANICYFSFITLFGLYSTFELFQQEVYPKRNQIRIGIPVLLHSLIILCQGEYIFFAQMSMVYILSGWLFLTYPIGGWSHAAFHLVIAIGPFLITNAAIKLPASQPQMEIAAKCALQSMMEGIK